MFHILISACEEQGREESSVCLAGKGGHAACSQQGRVASLDHHGPPWPSLLLLEVLFCAA